LRLLATWPGRAEIKILLAFAIDEQSVSLELRGDDEPFAQLSGAPQIPQRSITWSGLLVALEGTWQLIEDSRLQVRTDDPT
jgi:hypothetical protein